MPDTGAGRRGPAAESGSPLRFPGDPAGRFRMPAPRNVAVTDPRMHDGGIATLDAVLDHYVVKLPRVGVPPQRFFRCGVLPQRQPARSRPPRCRTLSEKALHGIFSEVSGLSRQASS